MFSLKRILFLLGVLLVAIVMAGTRQSVVLEDDILIDAEPDKVWSVLVRFHQYPSWNPFIMGAKFKGSDTTLVTGRHLVVTMQPGGVVPAGTDQADQMGAIGHDVEVIHVEPNRELRWASSLWLPFLFDSEHWFQLERIGTRTILRNGEKISGLFLFLINRQGTRQGFVAMNKALKARVEKLYPKSK